MLCCCCFQGLFSLLLFIFFEFFFHFGCLFRFCLIFALGFGLWVLDGCSVMLTVRVYDGCSVMLNASVYVLHAAAHHALHLRRRGVSVSVIAGEVVVVDVQCEGHGHPHHPRATRRAHHGGAVTRAVVVLVVVVVVVVVCFMCVLCE